VHTPFPLIRRLALPVKLRKHLESKKHVKTIILEQPSVVHEAAIHRIAHWRAAGVLVEGEGGEDIEGGGGVPD
jgi:hypothetical protein